MKAPWWLTTETCGTGKIADWNFENKIPCCNDKMVGWLGWKLRARVAGLLTKAGSGSAPHREFMI